MGGPTLGRQLALVCIEVTLWCPDQSRSALLVYFTKYTPLLPLRYLPRFYLFCIFCSIYTLRAIVTPFNVNLIHLNDARGSIVFFACRSCIARTRSIIRVELFPLQRNRFVYFIGTFQFTDVSTGWPKDYIVNWLSDCRAWKYFEISYFLNQ